MSEFSSIDLVELTNNIKAWGTALGFQQVGISDIDLHQHEAHLQEWLDNGYHGDMAFMESHGMKRARPDELVPGTLRVISVRMNYLPPDASFAKHLKKPEIGYISRYALGRDYHKVLRKRLKQLGEKITASLAHTQYRPFVDSAPVLEHAIAEKAGIKNFRRVKALNTHPTFIEGLSDLVISCLEGPLVNIEEASQLPEKVKLYPQEKWQWGWNNSSEVWNGRVAMIIFLVLFIELISGSGPLHKLGIL